MDLIVGQLVVRHLHVADDGAVVNGSVAVVAAAVGGSVVVVHSEAIGWP